MIAGPTNEVERVYTSPIGPNNVIFHLPATTPTASSSPIQYPNAHEKSALLRAIFESQPPTESPAPTAIVTDFKTRPESTDFIKNCLNIEKGLIFAQKAPEPIFSGHSQCANNIDTSAAPSTISTGLEMRLEMATFMKNHKNHRKSPILGCFKGLDIAKSLPAPSIAPTKHPCSLSDLFKFFRIIYFLFVILQFSTGIFV
jgi:hypothetical protein